MRSTANRRVATGVCGGSTEAPQRRHHFRGAASGSLADPPQQLGEPGTQAKAEGAQVAADGAQAALECVDADVQPPSGLG